MYLNRMKAAGAVVGLNDYRSLAALNRDDLVLWNEAEAQRSKDAAELDKKAAQRKQS